MFLPPGFGQRQETYSQIPQGRQRQNSGFRASCGREVGAGHRDIAVLIRGDLDLGMADVVGQTSQAGKLQRSSEERMSGVGDCDFPFAFLQDERGVTLGGVWAIRSRQIEFSFWGVRIG